MERWLGKHANLFYALFRIVAGLAFAFHGIQKFGWLGTDPVNQPLMIAAGVIELVGGLMIAAGVFTSIAAFISSGQMAAAYFMGHLPKGFLPINNGGELALIFCFAFLYIASRGTVAYGLTGARERTL